MHEGSGPLPERYLRAVGRLRHVLDRLEAVLEGTNIGDRLSTASLRELAGRPTEDSLEACLAALESLGILVREGQMLRVNRSQLEVSGGYRRGVRDTMHLLSQERESPLLLLATVPLGLTEDLGELLRREAHDLRAAILDLILGARRELVLASPFWDDETLEELAELLGRRILGGVGVRLVGRGKADRASLLELKRRLSAIECFAWYDSNSTPPITFHFKAAIADRQLAYLGSANFTHGGFWSGLELGYRLEGSYASQLARILEIVIRHSDQIT